MEEAEKRAAEPTSLADELPSPKRIQTCFHPQDPAIVNLPEPMDTSDASDSDSECTTPVDDKDEAEMFEIAERALIDEIVDAPRIETAATEMLKYSEIVQVLENLLLSLADNADDKLENRALNHFNKVEKAWRNIYLIGVLLKESTLPCSMKRFNLVAGRRLSAFLICKIKSDPLFANIYKYPDRDNASMIRNALSILLGYCSSEDNIVILVFALGGRSLGLKCVSRDASPSVVMGDNTLAMGEGKGESKMGTESSTSFQGMSDYSPIEDILQDASIKDLADQLSNIPEAVRSCKEVLESLQYDVPVGFDNLDDYHRRHRAAVLGFWFDPLIIVALIKALKQSTLLVNVFKKYIKGAQLLRCVDRMSRVLEDPWLNSILQSDDSHKRVRGALSILFGYWGDIDVVYLLSTLCHIEETTQTLEEVDLTKCDVQALEYLTDRPGDVEGLKNVLADKYDKNSKEYEDLLDKIKNAQESEEQKAVEPGYGSAITVLLLNGEAKYIRTRRFPPDK